MNEFDNNGYTPEPRGDEHTEQTAPQAGANQQQAYEPQQAAEPAQAPQNTAPPVDEQPPRTPYQTPVREQPPYQQQTPYQAYQSQQAGAQPEPPQPPKKKKRGNGPVIALCSVAAACLLFAGGALIGGLAGGGSDGGAAAPAFGNSNMPTVSISKTPDLDPDNYDVVNGLAGEEIYKKVNPSIVSVISTSLESGGTGSGVIMTEDGYIITNNHVIEGADAVAVQLSDGTRLEAKVIGADEKTDLAVLKVEPESALTPAEFGNSDELQPGEYAYAIGSPGGLELANTITGGRISAINRDITIDDRVMTLIQTDASINPGNSGGALINKYGQVVGITSAKLGISYYEGLGFAIPMNTAKEIVDELISNGYIAGRPSIGITGYNVSEQTAQYNNVPQGVYVKSVDERAAAYNEGLQPGDIITKVNGKTITTMDEINAVKEEKKAGEKLSVQVYRMSTGKLIDLTITLTDEHDLAGDSPSEQQAQQPPEQGGRGDNGYSQYDDDPFSYFFNW
ncbi:S1C family serine protease [Agathobaculum sp.]|uniref:S1C family serine protease n=1 Tax=Agathobaculum sp. TaxID=2048138 RepID=UPI002A8280B6|nr:trypsin-like peptidase domain-containing protein [Agathobaculum sp.]MDY3618127.1 trypsin-like peptidase domain-containing protein [Agathobaculum sp.]